MVRQIFEETWTLGDDPKLISRIGLRAEAESWEAAYNGAESIAAKFAEHRGFLHGFTHDEQHSYGWARAKDDPTVIHRFVVA
jgi:hypothetical protein